MVNDKSNFNQAFWLSISSASSMLVSILSAVILSRYFDKVEYGTYKQIIFVYNTLLVVFQAGLPAVFTYFLPRYNHGEGKFIVKKINRLLFIFGLFFAITIFLGANLIASLLNNPELAKGLKIFSIFPLFTLPTFGVEGIYTVNKNTKFVAIYNTITRLLMLLCIVLPVILIKNDYITAIYGWGVASFVTFIIAIIAKKMPYKNDTMVVIPNITKEIFKYTLPITGSALMLILFNSVNQFYISRYYGTVEFANYSNGFITLPFVPIIIAPIRALLTPAFAKASKDGYYKDAFNLLYSGMQQVAILILPLIVYSFYFSKDIMTFLYGQNYAVSSNYFNMFLVFNTTEIFMFSGIISAIGKPRINFIFNLLCTILIWIVDYILIKQHLSNALIIAFVFVLFSVMMQYILPYFYLTFKQKFLIVNKETLFVILKCSLHSLIVGLIVFVLSFELLSTSMPLIRLSISIVAFYLLLLLSSKIININYTQALHKIIKR